VTGISCNRPHRAGIIIIITVNVSVGTLSNSESQLIVSVICTSIVITGDCGVCATVSVLTMGVIVHRRTFPSDVTFFLTVSHGNRLRPQ